MQNNLFSSPSVLENLKAKYRRQFLTEYAKLNPQQTKAVDATEGPVMVIAGPGTGKTQILATRIGKIIFESDTQPQNILCLTFTDAATIAMRNRLVKIIGPDAHKVQIYTFHAFCNQVIQENLNIFGNYRQLEPLSDIERIDVFDELINSLPDDHVLKRLKGDNNFEAGRMNNLYNLMKKENITAEQIHQSIEEHLKEILSDDTDGRYFYKRKSGNNQKGDPKKGIIDALKFKYKETAAAADQLDQYESIKTQKDRYTYDDMILWVLKEFKNDDTLLLDYQERYQYFLVDEYQDTNGAQNELLDHLISHWGKDANIFVVGDDDQAIYKFQGANLSNIEDFYSRYQPELIILEENYRSNQDILDHSKGLIEHNVKRLVNRQDLKWEKNLIASGDHKDEGIAPQILIFKNTVQEQAYFADFIGQLHKGSSDLSNIAILYRNHSQVADLVKVLEEKGVPLNVKRKVNILKLPLIRNLLVILKYIYSELTDPGKRQDYLIELMHYKFFGLKPQDIAKMSLAKQSDHNIRNENWRNYFSDSKNIDALDLENPQAVKDLFLLLNDWISGIHNKTLQVLFGDIINDGHILNNVFNHAEKTWRLQVLSTFFDLIKNESSKDPDLKLEGFLEMIDKMEKNDISLGINKVVHADNGIHFITAHSAKGLEFDKVFMIGCTKNIWDNKRGNNRQYTLPENLFKDRLDIEDERRLFFVAMTRAKTNLSISYAKSKLDGRDLGPSQFVDELISTSETKTKEIMVKESLVNEFQRYTLLRTDQKIELIDHDLIDRRLQNYKLSVTNLNKYLRCPLTFYFETILQVPTARSKYLGFGQAVHYGLEQYFEDLNKDPKPTLDTLIQHFLSGMKKYHSHFTGDEQSKLKAYGQQILKAYYATYLNQPNDAKKHLMEHKIDDAVYKGVPIKGMLDRVSIYDDRIEVTDYKTGDPNKSKTKKHLRPPDQKNPDGGEYWRQMVFYKILTQGDYRLEREMIAGYMDFVEPDRKTNAFTKKKYVITQDDIDLVGTQIVETMEKIKAYEFNKQCDDEYCKWCNFLRNDYVLSIDDDNMEEDPKDFVTPVMHVV